MDKKSQELGEVIADLRLIKEAVSKSDSILRFVDIGGAMKSVLLVAGLLIAFLSGIYYYLVTVYGSLLAIPPGISLRFDIFSGIHPGCLASIS